MVTADEYWLQLRLRHMRRVATLLRIAPEPIWIRKTEVTGIVCVGIGQFTGLRFVTCDGSFDGVVIWTRHPRRLIDGLAALGWPIAVSVDGPGAALPQ